MVLSVQMLSILISFCYGMFFYFSLELSIRIIYSNNFILKFFGTLLFVLFHAILYFLLLLRINNGYVHVYFFLCIFCGYLLCKVIHKKIVKAG